MISKRQRWILWSSFVLLILLSAVGVMFAFAMRAIVPMALNDSSPNFSQIADVDRWYVYHEAQSLILPVALVMLGLAILWAALAGFSIWRLSKKSEHDHNEQPNTALEPTPTAP
jgi:flagellar basal body-associated protein FliL